MVKVGKIQDHTHLTEEETEKVFQFVMNKFKLLRSEAERQIRGLNATPKYGLSFQGNMGLFNIIMKNEKKAEPKEVKRNNTIVLDEGNGKIINDLWIEFNNVKTEKEYNKWSEKVKTTQFGTYGTIPFMETLDNFEPKYPNEVLKKDFITGIEKALDLPLTYKKKISLEDIKSTSTSDQLFKNIQPNLQPVLEKVQPFCKSKSRAI